ncbi:hypothetical protein [Rikenella microfusus]|uniref:hypothetical protein n=1 Tax=Rikenella microfusus TaxID=28139 RepID=UPI00248F34C9|nr:hypothetical protein [Rikenella microfusus]
MKKYFSFAEKDRMTIFALGMIINRSVFFTDFPARYGAGGKPIDTAMPQNDERLRHRVLFPVCSRFN